MALVVQKFGGTSVGSIEKIRHVAEIAKRAKDGGNEVVVVVSAMAGETNKLVALCAAVMEPPDPREYDVVVSTGEQVTIGLLSMALKTMGADSISLLGSQIAIHTDPVHSKARIHRIDDGKIRENLKAGRVVVLPGFQGVDENGNVTTLGRGGSDTSAVAIAAALKADACEIYTDVEGIFTADPNVVADARKISRISYDEMLEMASQGAKVLQIRSVEFAKKYHVPLHVRSTFSDVEGTWVIKEDYDMEKVVVSGVTCDKNEAKISVLRVPDRPGIAASLFGPIARANINVDMIIQNISVDGYTDMTFTVPRTDLTQALGIVRKVSKDIGARDVLTDEKVAKIAVIGTGMRNHSGVASRMFSALADEGINIMMVSTSEIKVSCVVKMKYAELAVRILHEAFDLGTESV
ncbi:MAG TPA: aspartate kinase [Proteobacteria bacterium]|nr:aspartokinase [bacterium BMS3Abin14]HDL53719.1 aspartate kinase [Pseudomonadota bacterium]